jgi:hypothetical protein
MTGGVANNHPDNLITLTVEEHAEAHKALWLMHGKWEDRIAYQTLAGQITQEEARREIARLANIGNKNAAGAHRGNSRHWQGKQLPAEMRKKLSDIKKALGYKPPTFTGHKAESKAKIGAHSASTHNITDGKINRRIPKSDPIPAGFRKGITMKKRSTKNTAA